MREVLTPPGATVLEQSMEPFTLRIDWTCWKAYGSPVEIELHRQGQRPITLSLHDSPPEAVGAARAWLDGRCLGFTSDIDDRQRQGSTYLTLTLSPKPTERNEG